VVELVKGLEASVLLEENIAPDPPRKDLSELVSHMGAGRDGEDVIEFFKGALLGLGDPEEDHNQSDNV
jgi:hypothetical protein